jgi:NADH-quinone oxidoreductase subunit N
LRGLIRRGRSLTASLTLGIGSLAGIPPSVGFFAKLYILWVLARAEMYGLLGLGIVSVAISIYYYFAIIREAVSRPSDNAESQPITSGWLARSVPLGLGALTLILGILTLLQGMGGSE